MHFGVVFPQTEFGHDPQAVRDYAQTVEGLGFNHILAYEHVLGGDASRHEITGPYTHRDAFLEPFVLYSFMAAVTRRLEFTTGILILPQRQTAIVAKQAATLDVLSGGRLRLGIGVGWNRVEYDALGRDFRVRGRRVEEQVELLRRLWTEPLVDYEGRWDSITAAGLNPLPQQRPIPIWFGGHADAVLRRAARIGDGWMPNYRTPEACRPSLDRLEIYLAEQGRDLQEFGLEARLNYGDGDLEELATLSNAWQRTGVTHLSLNTMRAGFTSPQQHLSAVRRFAQALLAG